MNNQQGMRDFDLVAARWDEQPRRVALARAVADTIIRETAPSASMHVLDFGCGTGLVTLALAPLVRRMDAADSSQGMLDQLVVKLSTTGISNVVPLLVPHADAEALPCPFDLIVSSMTMHHIGNVGALLQRFYGCLATGGQLCIADLETEDGSFHDDPTGIQHHGFSSAEMEGLFRAAGFLAVRTVRVMEVQKVRDGRTYDYLVNLTIGRREH